MVGRLRTSLFCAILSFSSLAYAENHLVYFGGGLSSYKPDVMFDKSLKDTLSYSKSKNLNAEFYYRKALPSELAAEDKSKIKELTAKAFKDKIRELTRSIISGKIKSGEQLLVYLDTHGQLVNGQYTLSADADLANGEDLQFLIRAAEKKGVKLGIIGATCYSGSLMKYGTPHTCIITLAQADKIGFYGDVPDLSAARTGLENLESLYLKSRLSNAGPASQPMISTEAGIRTDEMLSPLKSSIIDDYDRRNVLIRSLCTTSASALLPLEKEVKTLLANTQVPLEGNADRIKFLQLFIERYNALYIKVQTYMIAKNKTTCADAPFMDGAKINTDLYSCATQEQIEWIAANFYKPGENRQSRKGLTTGTKQLARLDHSYFIDQQNTEDYKNFQRLKKAHEADLAALDAYSRSIAEIEREIYDRAYKKASEESKAPNPCRDFKL